MKFDSTMYRCKNCGKWLNNGILCDCDKSKNERSKVKEVMEVSLKYVELLRETDDDNYADIAELNEAFRVVITEIAEKYGEEPKEFMAKVIDSLEEFLGEE